MTDKLQQIEERLNEVVEFFPDTLSDPEVDRVLLLSNVIEDICWLVDELKGAEAAGTALFETARRFIPKDRWEDFDKVIASAVHRKAYESLNNG